MNETERLLDAIRSAMRMIRDRRPASAHKTLWNAVQPHGQHEPGCEHPDRHLEFEQSEGRTRVVCQMCGREGVWAYGMVDAVRRFDDGPGRDGTA